MKLVGSVIAGLILAGFWYLPKPQSNNVLAQSPTIITTKPVASPAIPPVTKSSGKRLKIEVEVTSPGEILVTEGRPVVAQQVIVDRQVERQKLTGQLQKVQLAIERLKTAPPVHQVSPARVSSLRALPPAQYLEETAQVKAATAKLQDTQRKYTIAHQVATAPLPETGRVRISIVAVQQATDKIKKQQQKIDALQTIEDFDPVVRQHEEVKLGQLKQALVELQAKLEPEQQQAAVATVNRSSALEAARFEVTTAHRELELAKARLGAASEKRQQTEFEYQLKQSERQDQVQRLELERVKMLETGRLQEHERECQLAQLGLKRNSIQQQMAELTVVKAPYGGTIRRVKLVSQRGNLLKYEIVLSYVPQEVVMKTKGWQSE
jgi:hypothetical protein